MRDKKCSMCSKPFKENNIPRELCMRFPHIKGTPAAKFDMEFRDAKFGIGFPKNKNKKVCDGCLEPIMEAALMAIRKKVCPSMIDISMHCDLLKIAWPKSKAKK